MKSQEVPSIYIYMYILMYKVFVKLLWVPIGQGKITTAIHT
jgi:hypothetical protein